ncbi:hypothetical protein TBS_15290 [Thermobispora bispora]
MAAHRVEPSQVRTGVDAMVTNADPAPWERCLTVIARPEPSLSSRVRAAALGACAGAAIEYFLDPVCGRSRRARVSDKARRLTRRVQGGAGVLRRDLTNRARGAVARVRYRFHGRHADDRVLHERIRAELGRHVSHPHAVDVEVADGFVVLSGDVLEKESGRARRAVARIPGVKAVRALWRVHVDPAGVPQLQGGKPREPLFELRQRHWSPTARFVTGSAALAAWVVSRRLHGPIQAAVRVGCVALLARAAANLPLRQLIGFPAGGRDAFLIQDEICVAAPVDEVWPVVSDYERFTEFIPRILEVRRHPDGTSDWVLQGPGGVPVRFTAIETERVEGRTLSLRVIGRRAANTAMVQLIPVDPGRSRIQVRISYLPAAGAVGRAIASLFGTDPARELRAGLTRLRSGIEERARSGAATAATGWNTDPR